MKKKLIIILFVFAAGLFFAQNSKAATEAVSYVRQDCAGYSPCYTSLAAWEAAYGGIDFTGCTAGDLTCVDKIAVAQIDGAWTSADATLVTIDGWITDATRYIKIYTTAAARHAGKWDDTKYRLVWSDATYREAVLNIKESYTRVFGLQIDNANTTTYDNKSAIQILNATSYIGYNIIRKTTARTSRGIYDNGGADYDFYAYNNIIYGIDFSAGIYIYDWKSTGPGSGSAYVENNTVYGSVAGINGGYGSNNGKQTKVANNNLANGNTTDYTGTSWTSSANNISEDATSPNTAYRNKAVTFVDETNRDLHLGASDTNAIDQGNTNPSSRFTDDIDGVTRSGAWDIGADESVATPSSDTTPPVLSNGAPTGTLAIGTTQTTLSCLTTNENATCKYSISSGVAYSSMTNTFSTTGGSSHSQTITGLTNGSSYNYYVRCIDVAGNANTTDYLISFSVATLSSDTTPPVISAVTSTSITSAGATITWTTNEAADSQVEYGTVPTYGSQTTLNTNLVTSHSVVLSGLSASTLYYYRVKSKDASSNLVTSSQASFTTTAVNTINITSCGYLDQANTTYVLQNNVSATGSCFAIIAQNVTLDLNGKTVTYDNDTPITVPNGDFESGSGAVADNWDFANAPAMQRAAGTFVQPVMVYSGSYAIKISVPASDQYIRSANPIVLQPNITYSLSFMTYSSVGWTPSDTFVRYVELEGTGIRAQRTGVNDRGFLYTYTTFTPTSSITAYLRVGISGASGATFQTLYFDDIRIQRQQPVGVVIGPRSWSVSKYKVYDVNLYGAGTNAIVKNGTIIQGIGGGAGAHGIVVNDANVEIANLNITVYGANAKNILSSPSNGLKIHDNVLTDNVKTIVNRMAYDGAAIYAEYAGHGGLFYNNIITTSPQNGIIVNSDGTGPPHQIYGNTISLNSIYTNDFAIGGYGDKGTLIHDNVINCGSGNYSCRGIYTGGNASGTKVYNNTITVQELKRNQEYNGCELGGVYGIQVELASNIEVYNNTVTANADRCEAYAFRTNPEGGTAVNIYVHDNAFTAVKAGTGVTAGALKISTLNSPSVLRFENNILTTNDRWLYGTDGVSLVELKSNTFGTGANLASPFKPFLTYNYEDAPNCSRFIKDIKFIDNKYPDSATESLFENASITGVNMSLCTISRWTSDIDKTSSFFYGWLLTVGVKDQNNAPVGDASVVIIDKDGSQAFSNTTDNNGIATAVLNEFKNASGTKIFFNPYTVTVSKSSWSSSSTITIDSSKSITFTTVSGPAVAPVIAPLPIVVTSPTPSASPTSSTPTAVATTGGGSGGSGGGGASTYQPSPSPSVTSPITPTPTPATVSVPSPEAFVFTRNLTIESQGYDVYILQKLLNSRGKKNVVASSGLGSPGNETTYFGNFTELALKRLQIYYSISPASGFFGPLTRAMAQSLVNKSPGLYPAEAASTQPAPTSTQPTFTKFLYLGIKDDQVTALQQLLIKEGVYPEALVTGYFGTLTEKALQQFQVKYGIVSGGDPETTGFGVVGPKTRAKLNILLNP